MTDVERLERACEEARRRGIEVRLELLNGATGGMCEFGKRKWIFIDLAASVKEQLDQVLSVLRDLESRASEPAGKVA